MKKLILSELLLLFLATTFMTDSLPPGWYQQTLPVNKTINDIFFLDSLNGWVVASNTSYPTPDTGYIMRTTNGGNNWSIQLDSLFNYYAVQFLDLNNGYVVGGTGRSKFLKTTNGGFNWVVSTPFGSSMYAILDVVFVNKDTGWVCGDDSFGGGIYKTTNGGVSWAQQLGAGFRPKKLFFINSDTGWAGSDEANAKLYRTINGGINWIQQYIFTGGAGDLYFVSKDTGWATGGTTGLRKTLDGGFNWISQNNPGTITGESKLYFTDGKRGWVGIFSNRMLATIDGVNWGYQTTPAFTNFSVHFPDTLHGWAGTSILIHSSDGGGPINSVQIISSEIPSDFKLYQNYPNPFNPNTNIKYQIKPNVKSETSNVKLVVYNVQGKEIAVLVDGEFKAGTYEVDFDARLPNRQGEGLSSGVYFYKIIITTGKEVFGETKKMILIK